MTHTPTPWVVAENGIEGNNTIGLAIETKTIEPICHLYVPMGAYLSGFDNAEANAAFIVRAVNSHDKLVALIRGLRDVLVPEEMEETRARIDLLLAEARGEGS
jgi:hypothetical protein